MNHLTHLTDGEQCAYGIASAEKHDESGKIASYALTLCGAFERLNAARAELAQAKEDYNRCLNALNEAHAKIAALKRELGQTD